jgi:glycosyltransferase involved in cell wall biosynthesis
MRGAALHFLKTSPCPADFDGLIASDLLSLADFKALLGSPFPPSLVYFHENQLTYPLGRGEQQDYQFGFTNILTALTADRLLFNSETHMARFLAAIPDFLKMMPDCRPAWIVEAVRSKAGVLYPGCAFPGNNERLWRRKTKPPLIIWNHRWEHDKDPETFFEVLSTVAARGLDFRVALLGESYQKKPGIFEKARTRFGDRVLQYGYVQDKSVYYEWLKKGSVVVSTAKQENFGVAVVEAVRHGCIPLLPNALSYPEILPDSFHGLCLYRGLDDLVERLSALILDDAPYEGIRRDLAESMARFSWDRLIRAYDEEFDRLFKCQEGKGVGRR